MNFLQYLLTSLFAAIVCAETSSEYPLFLFVRIKGEMIPLYTEINEYGHLAMAHGDPSKNPLGFKMIGNQIVSPQGILSVVGEAVIVSSKDTTNWILNSRNRIINDVFYSLQYTRPSLHVIAIGYDYLAPVNLETELYLLNRDKTVPKRVRPRKKTIFGSEKV